MFKKLYSKIRNNVSYLFWSFWIIGWCLLIYFYWDELESMNLNKWFIGFCIFSLGFGSILTKYVMTKLYRHFMKLKEENQWNIEKEIYEKAPLLPDLVGITERTFFTFLIAFKGADVGTAMIAWIAIKMATGWNRIKEGKTPHRTLAFNALIGNVISLFIALIGGLIIKEWVTIKYRVCTILAILN